MEKYPCNKLQFTSFELEQKIWISRVNSVNLCKLCDKSDPSPLSCHLKTQLSAFVYLSSQFLQTPIQWKLSCLAILHIFTFNQNHLIQTFKTDQFVYFLFDAKTPDVADYVANKSTIIGYILWFSTNLVFWDENEKMISQGGGEKLSWFSQEFPGSRILAGLCHYSPANVLSTG